MRNHAMPDVPTPDPTARIAELEAQLARVTAERDLFKVIAQTPRPTDDPYTSPTPEEVEEMMHAPRGMPLDEILAEFGLGGGEP